MEKIGGGCAGYMKRQKKDEEADRNANRKLRIEDGESIGAGEERREGEIKGGGGMTM